MMTDDQTPKPTPPPDDAQFMPPAAPAESAPEAESAAPSAVVAETTADDAAPIDEVTLNETAAPAEVIETAPEPLEAEVQTRILPDAPYELPSAPLDIPSDWMADDASAANLDDALAAVSSLSDRDAEREATEARRAAAKAGYKPALPLPPTGRLRRGNPLSALPALGLMGFGGWLTLTSSAGSPPSLLVTLGVFVFGVALILILAPLLAGRWSRGTLFSGLLLAGIAALFTAGLPDDGLDLTRAYPLVLVVVGLAALLTWLMGRPRIRRAWIPALLCVLAGGVGLILNLGLLPLGDLSFAADYAPVLAIVLLVLWVLPVFNRRR